MFCSLSELITESDVEQKLIWPLLTTPHPNGLGLLPIDILTKANIRRLEIGKGESRKLYFPDYIVVIAGLPVLVVEAKAPGESLETALSEARLYGNEINAQFPSGVNPCRRVIACNGQALLSAPVDTLTPDVTFGHSAFSAASADFARFIELCDRTALQEQADKTRRAFRKSKFFRAVNLVGGLGIQNEEIASNTFGATIVGDYGHVFSPRTKQDRTLVVRHAYPPRTDSELERAVREKFPRSALTLIA